tara:strand:+ start:257 stop:394 length:138 start_codon:yes stop_codon:yes gene_type:complete
MTNRPTFYRRSKNKEKSCVGSGVLPSEAVAERIARFFSGFSRGEK